MIWFLLFVFRMFLTTELDSGFIRRDVPLGNEVRTIEYKRIGVGIQELDEPKRDKK